MLLIPVQLRPSRIHGLGVFAHDTVPAGTPVWRFQPGFDSIYSLEEFEILPEPARKYLRSYSYFDRATYRLVLNGDHGRFMNHSETPNTGAGKSPPSEEKAFVTVALADIPSGAEITCDYRAFDGDAAGKLAPMTPSYH